MLTRPKRKKNPMFLLYYKLILTHKRMAARQSLTSSQASFTSDRSYQVDCKCKMVYIDVHLGIGTTKKLTKKLITDKAIDTEPS
jgi:hypothetical protein